MSQTGEAMFHVFRLLSTLKDEEARYSFLVSVWRMLGKVIDAEQ